MSWPLPRIGSPIVQLLSRADAATLTVAGRTLVAFHDWTFLLGPGSCAGIGNGLLLGCLMYPSGLLPRRVAIPRARRRIVRLAGGNPSAVRRLRERVRPAVPADLPGDDVRIYLIAKGFTSPAMRRHAGVWHIAPPVAAIG